MRQLVLSSGILLASAVVAGATGGFFCEIHDENMTFSVSGENSRGMGGAILGYSATAEIKAAAMPDALRVPDLSAGLVHHWLDHPDLWLQFYAETGGDVPFSSFDLILKTADTGEEQSYAGAYLLRVFDGATGKDFELSGKVTCGSE